MTTVASYRRLQELKASRVLGEWREWPEGSAVRRRIKPFSMLSSIIHPDNTDVILAVPARYTLQGYCRTRVSSTDHPG